MMISETAKTSFLQSPSNAVEIHYSTLKQLKSPDRSKNQLMETISRKESESRGDFSNKRGVGSQTPSAGGRETILGLNHRTVTPMIRIPTA